MNNVEKFTFTVLVGKEKVKLIEGVPSEVMHCVQYRLDLWLSCAFLSLVSYMGAETSAENFGDHLHQALIFSDEEHKLPS